MRRVQQFVAGPPVPLAPEVLDHPPDTGALRMPEHQPAAGVLLDAEQVEVRADAAMVAPGGFFQALEIGLQRPGIGPGGAVDATKLLVGRVPAPVGAGGAGQLEGLEVPGGRHMRAAAEVLPIALAVQRDGLVSGNAGDDFGLVVFADGLEELHGLIAGNGLAQHRQIGLRQLLHALLDVLEVFRSETALVGKIVVEAVLDHRPDGHLGAGEKLLHGLRQQVRGGMPQYLQAVSVPGGDDRDIGIVLDAEIGVHELPADPAGQRRPRQTGADIGGHFDHAGRLVVGAAAAVGKRNFGHPAIVREMRRRSSIPGCAGARSGPCVMGPRVPPPLWGEEGSILRRRGLLIVPFLGGADAWTSAFRGPCRGHGSCRGRSFFPERRAA